MEGIPAGYSHPGPPACRHTNYLIVLATRLPERIKKTLRRVPFAQEWAHRLRILESWFLPHSLLFQEVYRRNHWGSTESVSGPGSTLEATEDIRRELPDYWKRLGVRNLVDMPCGDFNWMRSIVHHLDRYQGIDVVPEIIERNGQLDVPGTHFRVGNLLKDPIPEADAILVRDCLVHFSYRDIKRALANIRRSRIQYLFTTTYPDEENRDYHSGSWWRPLNLVAPPFSFPDPLSYIDDGWSAGAGRRHTKKLGVWPISAIPD